MEQKLRILITGASRGIGYAIAKQLRHRTEKFFLTSKYSNTMDEAIHSISDGFNGEIYRFSMDQSDAINVSQKIGDWIKSNTDYLDVVILCAGDFIEGKIQEVSPEDFIDNQNINFNFNYLLVNQLLKLLKESRCPKIIIIGSTAAYGSYSVPTYSISKWALRGFAINLRKELIEDKIGVTFISPGATLTDMWEDVQFPPNTLLEPKDIAKLVDCLFELSGQAVVDELVVRPLKGEIDE